MAKNDPYAALRYKEFNIFLLVRFAMVFAWSMQFVVIEWEVYSLTKDPLSLGIIGLMEVVPAVSLALFAGHIVDQKEKKGLLVRLHPWVLSHQPGLIPAHMAIDQGGMANGLCPMGHLFPGLFRRHCPRFSRPYDLFALFFAHT